MNPRRWYVGLLLAATVASGARLSFEEHAAVQESLARVHPRMRASWLRAHGLDDSYYTTFHRPESTGLVCVGRWPWGPSWELAGRDTFLYLGSGSGVRILSIADSVHPRMLGQINARSLVTQVVVQDTLLFVACGSWGAQIYSVSDPANPRELGSMDAVIGDLCIGDTFCYTAGGDSFRIYNFTNPAQPEEISAICDSGDVIAEANGYVYVGHGSSGTGLNVYDARNPHSPTLINALGGAQLALFIRGQLLFRTSVQPSYFQVLNISNPASIYEVGRIDGYGGVALYADSKYAYLSCTYDHDGLFVADISDSSAPQLRDSINPEGVNEWGPYVPHEPGFGYLADDYGGLSVLDLHDVDSISEVWSGYKAHEAVDIVVDGQRAYVADQCSGLQIIDVADPTRPTSLGIFDTVGSKITATATARDSFAFSSMSGMSGRRDLLSLNVLNPTNPDLVAQESCFNPPQDYVLRDSLLYAAEDYEFQIFDVARPREPVLVGSCNSEDGDYFGLAVHDTLAYEIASSLYILNVAQPSSPTLLSSTNVFGAGVAVRDTFVYVPYGYDTLRVYSAANPGSLRQLGFAPLQTHTWDVALAESKAVVATFNGLEAFSLEDPAHPHWRAAMTTPGGPRRVVYSPPYFYTAMWEAGVGIYSAESLGVQEKASRGIRQKQLAVLPNPARDKCHLSFGVANVSEVRLRDVAGRVAATQVVRGQNSQGLWLDVSKLTPGVYFAEVESNRRICSVKFVKQ